MRNIVLIFGTIALYLLLLIEWHLRMLSKRIDQAQRYLEQIIDLMRLRRLSLPRGHDEADTDIAAQEAASQGGARVIPERGDGA
jgi:hypothetical protein